MNPEPALGWPLATALCIALAGHGGSGRLSKCVNSGVNSGSYMAYVSAIGIITKSSGPSTLGSWEEACRLRCMAESWGFTT